MAQAQPTRPLSPHLQVWRAHITMVSSITHRATGMINYAAAVALALWLMALVLGLEVFQPLDDLLMSPLGQVALYGVVFSLFYHWAGGVRHLIWDTGRGLKPATGSMLAWLSILFSLAATAGVWAMVNGVMG
jgi:succinate dehydrogenase / fumarate reductase, cytochrome b subunit